MNKLQQLLYRGLPQNGGNPVETMRCRMANNAIVLIGLTASPFLIRAIIWQVEVRIFLLGTAEIMLLLSLWLLRKDQSHFKAVNFAMFGISAGVMGAVYSNGGLGQVAAGWLFVIPLFAGLMGGMRVGAIWSLISLLSIVLFWIAHAQGVAFPELTPGPDVDSQNRLQQLALFLSISGCMLAYLYQVKEAEKELFSKIEHLNQEIVDRKNAELEAFTANRTKSQFLTSMSHELRTPLNSVIGFSERLLKRRKASASEEELAKDREFDALTSISHNGHHLLMLINGLLDLSKLEAGQVQLTLSSVEISELVKETIADLQGIAQSSRLYLHNEFDFTCQIQVDRAKVKQILINLIGNSLKYTNEGGVTVSGAISNDEELGRVVSVVVKDTGIGIAEEHLPLLFEPYYNISSGEQRSVDSAGLGLSITKQLIDLHKGKISVTSELAKGSEFTVSFREGGVDLPPSQ